MRRSRAPAPPAEDGNLLVDALRTLRQQHDDAVRQARRKRQKVPLIAGIEWARLLKGTVCAITAVTVVLLGHGAWSETGEFHARLVAVKGEVTILNQRSKSVEAAREDVQVGSNDVILTGPGGGVDLVFADGTAIMVEPNTRLEVRHFDYARGARRDRSLLIWQGGVVCRLSRWIGHESKVSVCTPMAVASARGTAFRVTYEPEPAVTLLQVLEHQVDLSTPLTSVTVEAPQQVRAVGYTIGMPVDMALQVQAFWGLQATRLRTYDHPPGWLGRLEARLLRFTDPLLKLVGLQAGGWGYSSFDFARRIATSEALRQLRPHIEAEGSLPPAVLNPWTLKELRLSPAEQRRLLSTFDGEMLAGYRKIGDFGYEVLARSRDSKRTLYRLNATGIERVNEADDAEYQRLMNEPGAGE